MFPKTADLVVTPFARLVTAHDLGTRLLEEYVTVNRDFKKLSCKF